MYSVKSGYKAICEDARREEASISNSVATSGIWSAIWKLNVPGKIKHFPWRAYTNSLPTKTNLLRRKIISESLCHQCGKSDEDTKHALWDCEAIKQVWCVDFGWVNRFEAEQGNFLDLFDRMVSKSGKAELFAISARHIWVHRNKTRLKRYRWTRLETRPKLTWNCSMLAETHCADASLEIQQEIAGGSLQNRVNIN